MNDTTLRPLLGLALVVAAAGLAAGCDAQTGIPKSWGDVSAAEAPTIFERRQGHPALADLEGFYLGQRRSEARDDLERYCRGEMLRRNSEDRSGEAYFLGCRVDDTPELSFVRVGFWPRLDDRVATLEVKRPTVSPAGVYGALHAFMREEPKQKVLNSRVIQVVYPDYRFLADWDQGLDGPTHLTVGFDPQIDPKRVR